MGWVADELHPFCSFRNTWKRQHHAFATKDTWPVLPLRLDDSDCFDLDHDSQRQRTHADGGTGVMSGFAKHFAQLFRAAIDHLA